LARIPDLSEALYEAPYSIKRQDFSAFDLQIAYDKAEPRVEVSATVSEIVADAFENAKALQSEGSSVVATDTAGPIRLSPPRTNHRVISPEFVNLV
jgi:hypothetical protein